MDSYSFNQNCLLKNGEPWFPIMGEFHYSRFSNKYWKRSLSRMKSCGVDVVSSYTIWIHHEETEGEISFEGDLDVGRFVKVAGECGLKVFLRIGPWCHGEVRNGGFPDFLLKKDFEPRTNDDRYFKYVEDFYSAVFEQIKGLQHKDGGPIIGVQIENEYGHCGGLGGEEGEAHIRRLTEIARSVGFDVPYFTTTGWGGAVTGGLLPVMGAYCDAPWDPRTEKLEPNPNYLISLERNDKNIGSDQRIGFGLTFDTDKFPYLMAELGSALNSTNHRRLSIAPEDIGAMTLCKLAGGCNLLGYYMYHGGTNPVGRFSTFEESRETGSLNDMPAYNYDGYAPLGQWGDYAPTSRELRPLLLFLHEFGEKLCGMPATIPNENPRHADDLERLRYSWRTDGKSGFLFVNNFQRGYREAEHKNIEITIPLESEKIVFRGLNVPDGAYFFYPFNMPLGSATLKTAKATPLCKIREDYVFYGSGAPDYRLEGDLNGSLITITPKQAKHALKVTGKREYLLIADGDMAQSGDMIIHTFEKSGGFLSYPKLEKIPNGYIYSTKIGSLYRYEQKETESVNAASVDITQISDGVFTLDIAYDAEEIEDVMLLLDFEASKMKLIYDGKTVDDGYYTGDPVKVSLTYLGYPKKLTLELTPILESDDIYTEIPPRYENGVACRLNSANITAIRSCSFRIN